MIDLLTTDTEKCVKCGRCVTVCPMQVIEMKNHDFPHPTSSAYRLCINCGYCIDVCVFEALFHRVRTKRTSDSDAAMRRYDALMKKRKGDTHAK